MAHAQKWPMRNWPNAYSQMVFGLTGGYTISNQKTSKMTDFSKMAGENRRSDSFVNSLK